METYIIIVIIFGIITLLLLSSLFFINRITILKNNVEESFNPIKEYIEERIQLTDKILLFIKNNLENENDLKKEFTNTKKNLESITSAKEGINLLKESKEVFNKFNDLDKTYNNLKKNEEYKGLKEEFNNNENRINYTIEDYDKEVKKYNSYKETKIISILDKLLNFNQYTYYNK